MTPEEEFEQRSRVVEEAKNWLHIPWRHMGQTKAGADCGGLYIGVFKACNLIPQDFKPDYYPPDFMMHRDEEKFIGFVEQVGYRTDRKIGKPADIVLFKVGRVAAHCAMVIAWPTVMHSVRNFGVEFEDADSGELAAKFVGIWTLKGWT